MKKNSTVRRHRGALRTTTWGLTAAGLLASTVLPLTGMLASPALATGERVTLSTCGDLQTDCTHVVLKIVDTTSVYGQTPTFKVEVVSTDAAGWDPKPAALAGVEVEGVPSGADVGTYPLRLTKTGLPDDLEVTYLPGVHTVTPASLVVGVGGGSVLYGSRVTPWFQGLVNGDRPADIAGLRLVDIPEHPPVGDYYVQIAFDAPNPNYRIATSPGRVVVKPARLTIDPSQQIRYGDDPTVFRGTVQGLAAWDTAAQALAGLHNTVGATRGSDIGKYPVKAAYGSVSRNYVVDADKWGVLTIEKRPVTVKANNVTRLVGSPDPVFTASYAGLAPGQTAADIKGLVFESAGADAKAGTYPIRIRESDPWLNKNFRLKLDDGRLTVVG